MNFIDTHCHLHDSKYGFDINKVLSESKKAGVTKIITVGTTVADSKVAVEFAKKHEGVYATIGIHPNNMNNELRSMNYGIAQAVAELEEIIVASLRTARHEAGSNPDVTIATSGTGTGHWNYAALDRHADKSARDDIAESRVQGLESKLIGLGDIGLDYHYQSVDRERQKELLKKQLELAVKYDLPVQFHVRDAFDDFWPIFDEFKGLQGALHCYTDTLANLQKALSRGLYISVNGISTFNKNSELEKVFNQIPLNKLLLETDAPYLTPSPIRDKLNVPAYVVEVAKKWADRCGCELTEVSNATTGNATTLFSLR